MLRPPISKYLSEEDEYPKYLAEEEDDLMEESSASLDRQNEDVSMSSFYADRVVSGRFSRSSDDLEPSFNTTLIAAVKSFSCLYDQSDRNYRSTQVKNKVWHRLASYLNYRGDRQLLSGRWKQLRDKYGKEKKKCKESGEPSSWQYYKQLEFLDPHMTDRSQSLHYSRLLSTAIPSISDINFSSHLISEVQLQRCLYDSRDPQYRQADCRNRAWSIIIINMKYPGDLNKIAKQWKALRDHYVRERRAICQGNRDKSSWELYSNMEWMNPFIGKDREKEKRLGPCRASKMSRETFSGDISDENWRVESGNDYYADRRMHHLPRVAADVMLDGDAAFAASVISDIRAMPESKRVEARERIERYLQEGLMHVKQYGTLIGASLM